MIIQRMVVAMAVVSVMSACGAKENPGNTGGGSGGGSGGSGGGGAASTCTGSLTGEASLGITNCRMGWVLSSGITILGNQGHMSVSDESQIGSLGVTCSMPGGPVRTGTFALSDCTTGMLNVDVGPVSGSRHGFMATYDSANPGSARGSGTITVTSFEVRLPESNGTASWDVHGSAHGTLLPPLGDPWPGQIVLDLTF